MIPRRGLAKPGRGADTRLLLPPALAALFVPILVTALAATVAAALAACSPQPAPSPMPTALPSPTPADAVSRASPDVRSYLLLVRPVTSDAAIVNARLQPSQTLQALVRELDLVEPPPEMAAAHALLLEGYQLLAEGTALLETRPEPRLRAEAIFTQDWGQRQGW